MVFLWSHALPIDLAVMTVSAASRSFWSSYDHRSDCLGNLENTSYAWSDDGQAMFLHLRIKASMLIIGTFRS